MSGSYSSTFGVVTTPYSLVVQMMSISNNGIIPGFWSRYALSSTSSSPSAYSGVIAFVGGAINFVLALSEANVVELPILLDISRPQPWSS